MLSRNEWRNYDRYAPIVKSAGIEGAQFTLSGMREGHLEIKEGTKAARDAAFDLIHKAFEAHGIRVVRLSNRMYNETYAANRVVFEIIEDVESPYDDPSTN